MLFSACFEFAIIDTINEKRNHWYPTGTAWREKTIQDFITAANGVLEAKLK